MVKKTILSGTLFIFCLACTIHEPKLPNWDTQWTIYVTNEQVSMADAVNDTVITTAYNSVIGDSVLFISISDTTEPETIDRADRAFKADDDHLTNTIGVIELDPDSVETPVTNVEDMFGDMPDVGQVLPPIPPQLMEPEDQSIEFQSYHYITIDSAEMYIEFYNNLFMTIESGMEIVVRDIFYDTVIDTFVFPDSIPPNSSSESEHLTLTGKTVSNEMLLDYYVPIAGTTESITITQEHLDGHYFTKVHMQKIRVTEAEAIIPEQTFTESDSAEVDADGNILRKATVEEGSVMLTITNGLRFSTNVEITLHNLVDGEGNPKQETHFFEKLSTDEIEVDLTGYILQHHTNPGQDVTHMFYEVLSTTISTKGDPDPYALVTSNDSVTVDFTMDSAYVSYFEGYVEPTNVDIEPVEQHDLLDVSEIEGSLTLNDLVLTLDLYSEINFDIDVDLEIAGYHFDQKMNQITDSVIINVAETINRGMTGAPAITQIVLDRNSSNPSIVDLMAILPTDLKLTGSAVVEGYGSASAQDRLWAEYRIESPLTVQIDDPIIYRTEMDSLGQDELNQEDRDNIDKHLSHITAELVIANGLPLGAHVKFFMSTDSTELYNEVITDSSRKLIISEIVRAGSVGSHGFVDQPRQETISIELTDQQISIINNPRIYIATIVEIMPSGEPVSFRKNDHIRIDGMLHIDAFMNPEDE